MRHISMALAMLAILAGSCSSTSKTESAAQHTDAITPAPVQFNADSAYAFVQKQCDFGPRVPGTPAHAKCGDFIVQSLKQYGANVIEQTAQVKTFDGVTLNMRNIIGEINPDADQRILLLAHWDCRPWADNDPNPANHKSPVMGANDAASGVAVLLEMARAMQQKAPNIGIDLMMVDDEDWGDDNGGNEDSWALGTQYWATTPHRTGYRPMYGILLDMVGASGAQFSQELYSLHYAPAVVQEVWKIAGSLGYGSFFKMKQGGAITDDHVFVNNAGIPCIDIIDMRLNGSSGFFEGWHTVDDTMRHIDPATLKSVGQTLLTLIYSY